MWWLFCGSSNLTNHVFEKLYSRAYFIQLIILSYCEKFLDKETDKTTRNILPYKKHRKERLSCLLRLVTMLNISIF